MGIRKRKKEERRQQIMAAAKRVFIENGFYRATIVDIARKAEISPGTVYLYFRSKDDLYASLMLETFQFIQIRLKELKEQPSFEFETKITALWKILHIAYQTDPCILRSAIKLQDSKNMRNLSPKLISYINEEINRLVRTIAEFIGNTFATNEHRNSFDDAAIAWSLFSGMVLLDGVEKDLRWNKEAGVDVLLNGLQTGREKLLSITSEGQPQIDPLATTQF